jgi:hypothetical protein
MESSKIIKDFSNIKFNFKNIKNEKNYNEFLIYFKSLLYNLEIYIDLEILNGEYIFYKINNYNIISNNNLIYNNLKNFDINNYDNLVNLLVFIKTEYENLNNSQKWYNDLNITDIFINKNIITNKLILTLKPFKINNNYKSYSNKYNYEDDSLIKTIENCKYILINILNIVKNNHIIWLLLPEDLLNFYLFLDFKYPFLDDNNYFSNEQFYQTKNDSRLFKDYGVKNLYKNIVYNIDSNTNNKYNNKKYKRYSPKNYK